MRLETRKLSWHSSLILYRKHLVRKDVLAAAELLLGAAKLLRQPLNLSFSVNRESTWNRAQLTFLHYIKKWTSWKIDFHKIIVIFLSPISTLSTQNRDHHKIINQSNTFPLAPRVQWKTKSTRKEALWRENPTSIIHFVKQGWWNQVTLCICLPLLIFLLATLQLPYHMYHHCRGINKGTIISIL